MNEQWRSIVGYEGYEVSDQGRIRSMERQARGVGRRVPARILKAEVHPKDGHHRVTLYGALGKRRMLVHRIVLCAFVGEPSTEAPVGRHLNGNPDDNRLANLEWSTHSRNALDKVEHGTCPMRNRAYCPKGHAYEGENLLWATRNGRKHRTCRACRVAKNREQYLRRLGRPLDFEETA